MGNTHHTTTMDLVYPNTAFPFMSRRLARPATAWGTGFHSVFGDFDRHFAEMEQRMTELKTEVDPHKGAQGHSYSFSSSTIRSGDNAPVTQSSEEYRVAGGQHMKRTTRSVGTAVVEETVKDGETSRTLTNLNEGELAQFEEHLKTARRPMWFETRTPELEEAPRAPPSTPQAELPAALEQDIQRMQQ